MGNVNKKEQRRQSLKKQSRRQIERKNMKRILDELKEESYASAIQLEFSFTYDHRKGKAI